jgi:RNase P subunit RPR2
LRDCINCQQSLAGSDFTAPWEDGDNPYAYVTCRNCGAENMLEGYGEDDD